MDVIRLAHLSTPPRALVRPAIAIGNFDGVHRGHAALIATAREVADGGEVCALTFEPHPVQILAPAVAPVRLTTERRKLELLASVGADVVVVLPFTTALAAMPATGFVHAVLGAALGARHVVVGADFTYGQGRAGTIATLRADGATAGFDVTILEPVQVEGAIASSTRVRAALRAGDLPQAQAVLGRRFDVDGVVVRGAGRGKGLGIPTANLAPEGDLAIAGGIYAVTLEVDGVAYPAVASLGTNPTFVERGALTLEVHVLDFDRELYGKTVRVSFVARLRDELKYTTVEALLAQIAVDVAQARAILATR